MSVKVGLVACSKTKLSAAAPAGELYQSALFKKASAYCERTYDRWFILSAKYGLLDPKYVIEPYDKSLKTMTREERAGWAEMVLGQIARLTRPDAIYYFQAGQRYREFLVEHLPTRFPFEALPIGKQLAWYDAKASGSPVTGK